METHAINIIGNLIEKHGIGNMVLTLRIITESNPANQSQLNRNVIFAVNDICRLKRFTDLDMALIEAFDQIDLGAMHAAAKAERLSETCGVRTLLACMIIGRLERALEPLFPKPTPKPVKVRREPKPPAFLTRVPGVEKNIALGLELLALRSTIKGNAAFGHAVRHRFDVDGQHACEVMKVARAYGTRPEIFTRLSWNALLHLASPALPAAAREALERRILAGERIGAPEIRAVRRPQTRCRSLLAA
jgi:hypothetical protein